MTTSPKAEAWMYEDQFGNREWFSDPWPELVQKGWTETPLYASPQTSAGWIVGNVNADRWRTWATTGPEWTDDRDKATRYARRVDAEAVHLADEDAWRIEPYQPLPPTDKEKVNG